MPFLHTGISKQVQGLILTIVYDMIEYSLYVFAICSIVFLNVGSLAVQATY